MSNGATLTLKQTKNGNGTALSIENLTITTHELGIERRELIPNGRRNCHCLQSGMKPGSIILLTKTIEGQEWIICFPSKKKSILYPLTYMTFYGIGENNDGDEVAVRAETIEARGHANLKELLLSIKDPEMKLEEIINEKTGEISAFFLTIG